jgi:hypothetical protein
MAAKVIVKHKAGLPIREVELVNGAREAKELVIKNILGGDDYTTVSLFGPKVRCVPRLAPKYIRTDENQKEEDNLGSLPTY